MELRQIPLSQLVRHPQNTRKQQNVAQLEASIRSVGVLSNLVGQELPDGTIGILGGWHRRRAVAAIVQAGDCARFQGDPALATAVFPAGADVSPAEITAAENFARAELHPADEFDAIRRMIDEGHTVDDVALKLGRDPAHVSRLLKLANVAPELVELFREDKIDLEQLQALALTNDQALQLKVWKSARGHEQGAWYLKQAIMRKALEVGRDPVARYVGVEAYKKAGGVVTVDVFETDASEGYMEDADLVRKLAAEKLEQRAAQLRKDGWLWVEARLDFPRDARAKFGEAKYSQVGTKKEWAPNAKEYAGAVVTLDQLGKLSVVAGLVRAKDKKKREVSDKAFKAKARADAKAAGTTTSASGKSALSAPSPRAGKLSFATVQRLQGERTATLRAELAKTPRTMLAVFAAQLASRYLCISGQFDRYFVNLEHRVDRMNSNSKETLEASPRMAEIDAAAEQWIERLSPHQDRLTSWLIEAPEQVVHELLAFLLAQQIDTTSASERRTDDARGLLHATGVDMGRHWRVSQAWLETQPRGVVLAAVLEAAGKKSAAEVDKAKGKPALIAAALPVLEAAGWLPEPLRAPPAPKKKDAKQKAANDLDS